MNAFSALCLTLVNGLLGIISTKFIIEFFGSDFNGLNSTANQIVNVLLIIEGGFTLASNVALFSPIGEKKYDIANGILVATKKKFKRVSGIFLLVGFFVAVFYVFIVNSNLPKELIFTVIIMTIIPQAFNLYYATTYRVLLQSQQKEYIINIITMLTIGLGHIGNIIMIISGGSMWLVRFITMVCALMNSFMIGWYVKKRNDFIDFTVQPKPDLIKGTNDVMIQKITGVIYNSAPIVFLSISPIGGTLLASIYAVYNNVFTMIKSLLHSVIDAPRLGIGQVLSERSRKDVWNVFKQYEFISFFTIFIMLTTTCTLILPFIKLYTTGVNDINYYDSIIALLMVIIAAIEMLHIPSGHLINMAGEFRVSKNFQLIACAILLISMSIGGSILGIYGMLIALLVTAISLSIMEMGYVHISFFEGKLIEVTKTIVPFVIFGIILCIIENSLPIEINGYLGFFLYGLFFFIINTLVAIIISFIFERKQIVTLISRTKTIFNHINRKG